LADLHDAAARHFNTAGSAKFSFGNYSHFLTFLIKFTDLRSASRYKNGKKAHDPADFQ